MAVDPITSIAEAIVEIAKVIGQAFNGPNRKIMLEVKAYKRKAKACDVAEEIFRKLTDVAYLPKDKHKKYWKLREEFDKED